jgi:hydrogenase expression/formation protein HypC
MNEPPRRLPLLDVSAAAPVRVTVPECHDDVCITCSDQAVPVRVIRLLGDGLALVDTGVSQEEVSVALVDAQVGDTILVHAKEALTVVREEGNDGSS